VLTLWAGQPQSLWDDTFPIEVRELPEDLAASDAVLSDPELLMMLLEHWPGEATGAINRRANRTPTR
jgi:hypothetical protein